MTQFNFNNRTQLFTNQPPNAKCVEVGTRYGDLALEVVTARPDIALCVVDSWEGKFAEGESIARAKLGERAWIIKGDSVSVAKNLVDHDFVYIDAAHDYASVMADLEAWWPVVKKGGMMGGHDYEDKPDDGFWGPIEVKQAVDEWAKAKKLDVHVVEPDSCPSWWVKK